MKTTAFTIGLIAGLVALLNHDASAATRHDASPHGTTFTHKHQTTETRRPVVELQREVSGVLPRAIRGGNPLQMLNPYAPQKYGASEENVLFDPDAPGKWDGIKLLSMSF